MMSAAVRVTVAATFVWNIGNVIALPACDSSIFCYGPLLDAAQNAYVYNDSKSFVDTKLNSNPDEILTAFQQMNDSSGGNISSEQMKSFVSKNFSPPGSELETWSPNDWTENPDFISTIKDAELRKWAIDLNAIWKELGRKLIEDVKQNPSLYSFIPVDNPFIIPGGRFREFYYWDTYWIVRGLLLCEMTSTVKEKLDNFLSLVERLGFIPNGGRIYYKRRSQPPLLIPMFDAYFQATDDLEYLNSSISLLEMEYNFWTEHRQVSVNGHVLNRYASDVNQPRPESYREDSELIADLSKGEGELLMMNITSACESGWDFSSRWAGNKYDVNKSVLTQVTTRNIIPVDLNSILALNEKTLARFHKILGNETAAKLYEDLYEARAEAIEKILWNDEDGSYYDFDMSEMKQNRKFFASNLNPLWTKCYPSVVNVTQREGKILRYLENTGVLTYPGGIPTSLNPTGQQWDFPNAWPPLVHMIIDGMEMSQNAAMRKEALTQATKWIRGNYKAYKKTNAMFEKYDVTAYDGVPGSGGEYDVQKGFGWTNGVILTLLDKYGDAVTASDGTSSNSSSVTNADTPAEMTLSPTTSGTITLKKTTRSPFVLIAIFLATLSFL